jgi:hypothetical protein
MITNRNGDDLPLGFMTPDGDDAAAKNRRASVDAWVAQNHGHRSNHPKAVVMPNTAMAGFRLLDDVRRDSSWGSGNVKWRVEDPRGFELEISSPNLMNILASTVVDQGEVLDRCIWAREGKENILVPLSSEVYQTAVANTAREAKTASIKDTRPGDAVVLRNGDTGIYLGRMNMIDWDYTGGYNRTPAQPITVKLLPRHVFVSVVDRNIFYVSATPKLSEVTPGTPISPDEAENNIAAWIADGFKRNGSSYGSLGFTFSKTLPTVTREKVVETWDKQRGHCVFEVNGEFWSPSYLWESSDEFSAKLIAREDWVDGSFIRPIGWRSVDQDFKKSDLIAAGVTPTRVVSVITTDAGARFIVGH